MICIAQDVRESFDIIQNDPMLSELCTIGTRVKHFEHGGFTVETAITAKDEDSALDILFGILPDMEIVGEEPEMDYAYSMATHSIKKFADHYWVCFPRDCGGVEAVNIYWET